MELSAPNTCAPVVFNPPRRRRHRHHYHSDSDTDSTDSASSYSSDSDDSTYHRVSLPHRARRRWRWPRSVITYPGYSPWAPGEVRVAGGGVVGGLVSGPGLVNATTVFPQLQTQVQLQQQQQQQQQNPRRYGYRRFHYQGGERVRRGCGHGHGHGHHHHHHRRAPSPRRCILPRFGRWLIGDLPERQRWRRCDDGAECCDDGCGVGTTPTVHHEDEYWGPGVGYNWSFLLRPHCCSHFLLTLPSPSVPFSFVKLTLTDEQTHHSAPAPSPAGPTAQTARATPPGATAGPMAMPPTARTPSTRAGPSRRSRRAARPRPRQPRPCPRRPSCRWPLPILMTCSSRTHTTT